MGIIYVLTNPVMPGLVKIGKTDNLEQRITNLSSHAGVPVPFVVDYACEVENADMAEQQLLLAFGDHRINQRREFFRISPHRIISALQLANPIEVTPGNDFVEDNEEQEAQNREQTRGARFKFSKVGIEIGATLSFARNENITAVVANDRQVNFEGQTTSLTQSALTILNRDFGWNAQSVAGPVYWLYDGETLSERRARLEDEGAD